MFDSRSSLSIVLAASMITLGVSPRQGNDVAASLAKAEAAWRAHRPRSYEFTIALGCFCPPSTPPTFRVTDGQPAPVGDIDAETQRRYSDYNTIEKLFTELRSVAAAGAHKMIVTYDEKLGYPTDADVDPKKDALDDQFSFKVTNFRILGGGEAARTLR
jgi:Family of unknown function (DUF6174)